MGSSRLRVCHARPAYPRLQCAACTRKGLCMQDGTVARAARVVRAPTRMPWGLRGLGCLAGSGACGLPREHDAPGARRGGCWGDTARLARARGTDVADGDSDWRLGKLKLGPRGRTGRKLADGGGCSGGHARGGSMMDSEWKVTLRWRGAAREHAQAFHGPDHGGDRAVAPCRQHCISHVGNTIAMATRTRGHHSHVGNTYISSPYMNVTP